MQKLKVLFFAAIIASTFSCKKSVTATTLEVTVTGGSSGAVSSGATVNLYESAAAAISGSPKYSQVTDATGKTKFNVAVISKYYVIVKKGSATNYYNGYIPVGIFTSQTDINNSPGQTPPGVVGGLKFYDTNHDGVINAPDVVSAPSVDITANINNTFGSAIY
jgi:hypothetical protein